jgi:hypothetical protein
LMRGVQEGATPVAGMVFMASLGMMVYALKQWEAGRELSANPARWVAEGVDRSGILSILFEAHNTTEKMTGIGLNLLLEDGAMQSRFATRSATEALGGPMVGFLEAAGALAKIPASVAKREWNGEDGFKPADVTTIRKMVPFASLPYLRPFIDGGYGMNDGVGFDGVVPELREAVAQ